MNDELPPPLEDGRLAQTAVEYLGGRRGNFTIRGHSSRREYRFAQSPDERWRWVVNEDLQLFRNLSDFHVDEDCSIDPIRDARLALERRIEALERQPADIREPAPRPRARQGRPPIPDEDAARAWHLHHHLDWRWRAVAEYQGIGGDKPEAAVQQRASRWAKRAPDQTSESRCNLCLSGDCPASPE